MFILPFLFRHIGVPVPSSQHPADKALTLGLPFEWSDGLTALAALPILLLQRPREESAWGRETSEGGGR